MLWTLIDGTMSNPVGVIGISTQRRLPASIRKDSSCMTATAGQRFHRTSSSQHALSKIVACKLLKRDVIIKLLRHH